MPYMAGWFLFCVISNSNNIRDRDLYNCMLLLTLINDMLWKGYKSLANWITSI